MKDDNNRDEDFLDEEEGNDTDSESIGNDEDDEIIENTEKKSKKSTQKNDDYEEDDYEEEYDDDDDDDEEYEENGKGKAKIIVISIIIAALVATAGILTYKEFAKSSDSQEPQTTEEQQQEENKKKELTVTPTEKPVEASSDSENEEDIADDETTNQDEEETALPTSTPKPLPTATPTVTPVPENSDYDDMYGNLNSDASTQNDDSISASNDRTEANAEPADIIFLGDLRFRSMANVATGETALWECSSTGDYSWMTETAYPDVDSRVGTGTKVFISMGFNDLTAYQSYATSINAKAAEWQAKGAEVYFVSVGPVAQTSQVANSDIMTFNTYMYQNLNIPFIDAYNYLVDAGYDTTDGQTYSDATSTALYNYLMGLIGR